MRRNFRKLGKVNFSGQKRRLVIMALAFQLLLIVGFWAQTGFAAEKELGLRNHNEETKNGNRFLGVLYRVWVNRGLKKEDLCDDKDAVTNRILREYGSIFIVSEKAVPPAVCIFKDAGEVEAFQKKTGFARKEIAGAVIELQPMALEALLLARDEAQDNGFDITPQDGAEAGRRSFADTMRLWRSRFEPACEYWRKRRRLTAEQVQALKSLPVKEQVRETLELEKQGMFFSTRFNYSILQSVAAPGTSQHLSMLAFDVNEYENAEVRKILAKHGWYRTVRNDQPHFTFLGHKESKLKNLGLRKVVTLNGEFWVPDLR